MMKRSRRWMGGLAIGAAAGLAVIAGCGEEQSTLRTITPANEQQAMEDAGRVLEGMWGFYRQLDRVSVNIVTQAEGELPASVEFAAERPARVAVRNRMDGGTVYAMYSDGEVLTEYAGLGSPMYSERPAPESLDALLAEPEVAMMAQEALSAGAFAPHVLVLSLMGDTHFERALEHVERAVYLGQANFRGILHDVVRVETERIHNELWIAAGDEPWLSQIVPDMTPGLKELEAMLGEQAQQILKDLPKFTITFEDWSVPESFEARMFAFDPPERAQRVESLAEAIQESMASEHRDDGQMLMGEAAPPLDLEMLGGGVASLDDHRGEVVILDFWASWCPPCVRGLPILARVAEKYREQGVVFYAINVREAPATVERFLEQRELDIAVPLDRDGMASRRYDVRGLPQTVLIGRDGTVQAVHLGVPPDLEKRLTEEVEALLEGRSLVGIAER